MARLVVAGVVGFAVGYFFGPQAGLQAFALTYGVTGFLDKAQKLTGPRLSDLKAPQAAYGSPIAYIEGAPRGAWNVAWASDKREIANTDSQGKGGPGVQSTTFTYEMDVLYLISINSCQAVRRVWSNGKLVWSNGDDADDATLAASGQTTTWRDIRFYDGNASQLPDPTYEAAVGVGNAPAYRGRTTIMVEGLNLGGSGQPPVLTFEVCSEASFVKSVAELTRVDQLRSYVGGIPAMTLAGFDMLVGYWDPDPFAQVITRVDRYSVGADGTTTLIESYDTLRGPGQTPYATATGNSDVSCIVISDQLFAFYYLMVVGGSGTIYDCSTFASGPGLDHGRFSRVGNDVVIGAANGSFNNKVARFAAGGSFLAVSASLGETASSIAIGGGLVYVLGQAETTIYVRDLATLGPVGTITTPFASAAGGSVICDSAGDLFLCASQLPHTGKLWKWNGAAWVIQATGMGLVTGDPNTASFSMSDGALLSQDYLSAVPNNQAVIRYIVTRTAIVLPTLDQVVRRLCLRTGQLTDADIDVTALAPYTVRGMPITQPSTARQAIEQLMGAYFFEAVEGEKLKFVLRGGASALTIPYLDLGASPDGTAEPLPLQRLNDPEVAARVSVQYSNTLNDYQDGLAQADRLVTSSTSEQSVQIPMGFTPTEAAKIADSLTMDLAASLIRIGPIALPRKYSALEPTDVVTLTGADGSTYRARITQGTIGGGLMQLTLILDNASVVNSVAATDSSYASTTLLRVLSSTDLILLDIPILRDADDAPGFYAAFGSDGMWPGAELDKSPDNVTYSKVLNCTDRDVAGLALNTLGDFVPDGIFDELNELTVDVGAGVLTSLTTAALLAGTDNSLAVGSPRTAWEIIRFRDATFVSAGVYTLTGLLRGQRGTEWAKAGHSAAERVVLLQTSGIRRVTEIAANIGIANYWKAVTFGKSRDATASQTFTDTGVGLKPFAPVDLQVTRTATELSVSWDRRSRLASRLFGADPPLGELTEAYDFELRDGSAVLVDSGTVSVPSYTASGLAAGDYITPSIWGMQDVGGTLVAIRQEAPALANSNPATSAESILALNPDGTVAEQSATLENIVTQWTFNGSDVYVVGYKLTHTIPNFYSSSTIDRLTLGALGVVAATNSAATPGDYFGVAFDGADIWVSEQLSDNVRRLNASTLASIAAYAMVGSPGRMQYASGKLYVICQGSGELVRFDTTSHTEDYRITAVDSAGDLLVVGSVVFVMGGASIGAYNAATGALISTVAVSPGSYLWGRNMVLFGTDVVMATPIGLVFIDATTGLQTNAVAPPVGILDYAAGSDGSDLYLTGRSGAGFSEATRKYTVATPGLSGYSLTVWQKSSVVGRGYPATLEL